MPAIRLSFPKLCLVVLASLPACGDAKECGEPDSHSYYDTLGVCRCEDGYVWADPDDAYDQSCVSPGDNPKSVPASTRSCVGSARSCSRLDESACDEQAGCESSFACRGSTNDCSDFDDESDCEAVAGCSWDEWCAGSATFCSYYSRSTCTMQDGCYWSDYYDVCSGYAQSCQSYWGSYSCVSQDGCYWRDACEGTATSCSSMSSESSCTDQAGCSWELADCDGSAASCDAFENRSSCESQIGCRWE